jgi:soluble lytic murein transglycosylase-like protein
MRFLKILVLLFTVASVMSSFDAGIITPAEAKSGKHRTKSHGRKSKKVAVENVWDRLCNGLRIPIYGPSPYGSQQLAVLPNKSASPSEAGSMANSKSSSTKDKTGRISSVIIPKKSANGEPSTSDTSRIKHVFSNKKASGLTAEDHAKDHYTALGRLKLAPKEPKDPKLKRLYKNKGSSEISANTASDSVFKSGTIQRYRTRLGLHPELYKNGPAKDGLATDDLSNSLKKRGGSEKPSSENAQLVINGCADFNKNSVIPLVKQGLLSSHYMQLAEECRLRQNASYARINRHIGGYGRDYLQRVGERARPYLYHIVDSLAKYGLPIDLALLPIVESAYQPTALSSANAAGIWQFIPSTGREFRLAQTADYDERLNIIAETQAAVRFLSGLRDHYGGDWWLTLAAYNAGPGTVDDAISRNREAGLGRDFWSLDLPSETMDYVPRLLALSSIFRNVGASGLKLRPLKNEPYFIKVNIDREIEANHLANKDLSAIAKLASFDAEEFGFLNAAYLKPTLPTGQPLSFLLPIRNANLLHQSLAFLAQANKNQAAPPPPAALITKTSQSKTDIPLISLQLDEEPQIFSNKQQIKIFDKNNPILAKQNEVDKANKYADKEDWVVHYLENGESLKTVADFHGVDEELLREANHIKRKQVVSLGQRLLVPLKFLTLEPTKKRHPSILFNSLSDSSSLRLLLENELS